MFFIIGFTIILIDTATAQWFNQYPFLGFFSPSNIWVSPFPFLSPINSQLGLSPVLSVAPPPGILAPLQSPIASIAGTTTIFLPPSAITDIKILIKPPELDTIKLEELVAPFIIYLYPEGYEPEGLFGPATIAGGLLPFYPLI